jgi:hypothetical protein
VRSPCCLSVYPFMSVHMLVSPYNFFVFCGVRVISKESSSKNFLFIFSLFNNAVSNSYYIILNDWMTVNNELEGYGRKQL